MDTNGRQWKQKHILLVEEDSVQKLLIREYRSC